MPFNELFKKKEKIEASVAASVRSNPANLFPPHANDPPPPPKQLPQATEFTFMRSDTNTQEFIHPPKYEGDDQSSLPPEPRDPTSPSSKRFSRFRKGSVTANERPGSPPQKEHKRLSQRFHLSRSQSASSVNVPENLPDVPDAYSAQGDVQEKEARWEERATILASQNPITQSGSSVGQKDSRSSFDVPPRPSSAASDANSDVNIQEAIRLHEAGELKQATDMFYILAERGNVLSQVLYGLSLRHGWGCSSDPQRAIQYLSAAASNSAAIESEALKAGMKKGGAAKGELVLAIFELANCYRYGWGVPIDKAAARQYYETAANLGDTDAMDQAAWCYLEGFGGKKDKFKAAQLLRLAEKNGAKTLGNTWIWKEKYNPK